jgi:hypothetical protein
MSNDASALSPADRLGAIIMALIVAIAARAGVRLPNWLLKEIEEHLKGISESFALLAAQVREGKYAPLPATRQAAAKSRRACGNARSRSPERPNSRKRPRRTAAQAPEIRRSQAPTRLPRLRRSSIQSAHRPSRSPAGQKTAWFKHLPRHAHFIAFSK